MKRLLATLLVTLFALAPSVASAAGYRILEQGNAAGGMAHAVTASVEDASAVYYNPAAMVEVGKYAAEIGVQAIDPRITYTSGDTEIKTDNVTYNAPHLYIVKAISENDLAVGLGVFSGWGLGSEWTHYGPFRYLATETKLSTYTTTLNVAKRLGDVISIGGGVDYLRAEVQYDSQYPFALAVDGADDGTLKMNGTGDGFGFNVAALFTPAKAIKIGVTYRSAIESTIEGDAELSNIPSAMQGLTGGRKYISSAEVNAIFPAVAALGVAWQATESFLIEVDVDYTAWSAYESNDFTFGDPLSAGGTDIIPSSTSVAKNYEDTIAYRVGAAFKVNQGLTVRAGFMFDPTPVPDETVDPRLPDNDRTMVSAGFTYKAADNFYVSAAYARVMSDARVIENSGGGDGANANGEYQAEANVFGASFGYQF